MKPLLVLLPLLVAVPAAAGELDLEITGTLPGRDVYVALYDTPAGFAATDATHARLRRIVHAADRSVHLRFTGLAPGRYAVTAYSDRNGNHRLDSNFLGMPTEPYGFSRDARSRFGAPGFAQAAFGIDSGRTAQLIHLQ